MEWKKVSFDEAIKDKTGGNVKLKKRDFLETGIYPIIDQGQEKIAGYTNNESELYQDKLPVILFGDHTRIFKFVDFPFALGADGVKVLVPNKNFDTKFLYYYFLSVNIPNKGYSRHFKYLKEILIPLLPISEQRRIVEILDQADALRKQRIHANKVCDRILPALFLKMFGDPATNPMGWDIVSISSFAEVQGGLQLTPRRKNNPITAPYLRVANVYRDSLYLDEIKYIKVTQSELKRTALKKGDILIVEGHGNQNEIGRSAVWDGSIDLCLHQNHLIRVRVNPLKANSLYVNCFINSSGGREQLFRLGKTTSGLNTISVSNIKKLQISLPPLDRQIIFKEKIEKIQNISSKVKTQEQKLETLFNILLHRAFSGELTAKWREGHLKELLAEMEHQNKALNQQTELF